MSTPHQRLLLETPATPDRLSRTQLVDRILELNPSATTEFLTTFNEDSLAHYLEHLCVLDEPCVPWVRRGMKPAIVRRESAA
jgi:hypothetical protein